ncbi:MAG TPA: acetyl-CoA carboxylase biotin carboxyl carrier protein [Bacteroidia bacterium]|nr:acetyl-CoA carboxylase biotin carboxyl carrier protein [Bacteroidia bacterium]
MKLTEIQDLIKFVAKSGVSEVELETKDIKITIKTGGKGNRSEPPVVMQQPVMQGPAQQPLMQSAFSEQKAQERKETGPDESKFITIKSPMIGTFYRSAGPDKPSFVNIGDEIKPGKVLCIIEAMKLFNEIESEVSGRIVKVLVDDASPVEYDQPLFLIEPA